MGKSNIGIASANMSIDHAVFVRQGIKEFSDWPTIPQLYVKGEFVGGCDIVNQMEETGDLNTLLEPAKAQ